MILNADGLIQFIYFVNTLTSKSNIKDMFSLKEVFLLFPQAMGDCGFIVEKKLKKRFDFKF